MHQPPPLLATKSASVGQGLQPQQNTKKEAIMLCRGRGARGYHLRKKFPGHAHHFELFYSLSFTLTLEPASDSREHTGKEPTGSLGVGVDGQLPPAGSFLTDPRPPMLLTALPSCLLPIFSHQLWIAPSSEAPFQPLTAPSFFHELILPLSGPLTSAETGIRTAPPGASLKVSQLPRHLDNQPPILKLTFLQP